MQDFDYEIYIAGLAAVDAKYRYRLETICWRQTQTALRRTKAILTNRHAFLWRRNRTLTCLRAANQKKRKDLRLKLRNELQACFIHLCSHVFLVLDCHGGVLSHQLTKSCIPGES
jgi:hypothetical protein